MNKLNIKWNAKSTTLDWKIIQNWSLYPSIKEEAILKATSICESTGGQKHHQQQCTSIPTPIDEEKH